MEDINKIIDTNRSADDIIGDLSKKFYQTPSWSKLRREYYPTEHPVVRDRQYRDLVNNDGTKEIVTRVTYDLQRLAVHRMTELCYGIPVKRNYEPENERQATIAKYIENIFQRSRIDSVNIERSNKLFSSCEMLTIWYAIEEENTLYGFKSPLKLRCRSYSPMDGDELYPYFNENGDMIAISVAHESKSGRDTCLHFDTYTSDTHLSFVNRGNGWEMSQLENYNVGKIPAIYVYRQTPIWEDTSRIVYEMEWAMSRNGNYLRKNSKPILAVCESDGVNFGNEKDERQEFRSIVQLSSGGNMQYITWQQAVENLKFYISELRQTFFTQLQLPDWSYESMKSNPMSGESRKQLFIDAQLKVKEESGRLLEFHDRELNVIKSFLKNMAPEYSKDIDELQVGSEITPFSITDEKDTISNIMAATAGKQILSQKEGIQILGWSKDADETLKQINEESVVDISEPTV